MVRGLEPPLSNTKKRLRPALHVCALSQTNILEQRPLSRTRAQKLYAHNPLGLSLYRQHSVGCGKAKAGLCEVPQCTPG